MLKNPRLVILLSLCCVLLVTNRWLSYEEGISILIADDTKSYMAIAQAAPVLPAPTITPKLASNHTIRLVPAWLVGTVAHLVGASEELMFLVFTLLLCAGIVWVLHRILSALDLSDAQYALCATVFIVSPYTFRYYLAVPAMLGDMVFVLGLAATLLGLLRVDLATVLVGGFVAVLGRQNAIVFLPAVLVWLWFGSGWSEQTSARRLFACAALSAVIVLPYIMLGRLTAPFSERGLENEALVGIFLWLQSSSASGTAKVKLFVEYLLRMNIALLFPAFIALGGIIGSFVGSSGGSFSVESSAKRINKPFFDVLRQLPRELWLALLMSAALYGFAFLGGPELFMSGVTRYVSHTMAAVVIALALVLRECGLFAGSLHEQRRWLAVIGVLCFVSSLHHLTTWVWGSETSAVAKYFAVLNIVLALAAGVAAYLAHRLQSSPLAPTAND